MRNYHSNYKSANYYTSAGLKCQYMLELYHILVKRYAKYRIFIAFFEIKQSATEKTR
jgi:hypothetical protein